MCSKGNVTTISLDDEVSLQDSVAGAAGFRPPCNFGDFHRKATSAASNIAGVRSQGSKRLKAGGSRTLKVEDETTDSLSVPLADGAAATMGHLPTAESDILRSGVDLDQSADRLKNTVNEDVQPKEYDNSQTEEGTPDAGFMPGTAHVFVNAVRYFMQNDPAQLTQLRVNNAWWALNAMREYHIIRTAPDEAALAQDTTQKKIDAAFTFVRMADIELKLGQFRQQELLQQKKREWAIEGEAELQAFNDVAMNGTEALDLLLGELPVGKAPGNNASEGEPHIEASTQISQRTGAAVCQEAQAKQPEMPGVHAAKSTQRRLSVITPEMPDTAAASVPAAPVTAESNGHEALRPTGIKPLGMDGNEDASMKGPDPLDIPVEECLPPLGTKLQGTSEEYAAMRRQLSSMEQKLKDREGENAKLRTMLHSLSHSNSSLSKDERGFLKTLVESSTINSDGRAKADPSQRDKSHKLHAVPGKKAPGRRDCNKGASSRSQLPRSSFEAEAKTNPGQHHSANENENENENVNAGRLECVESPSDTLHEAPPQEESPVVLALAATWTKRPDTPSVEYAERLKTHALAMNEDNGTKTKGPGLASLLEDEAERMDDEESQQHMWSRRQPKRSRRNDRMDSIQAASARAVESHSGGSACNGHGRVPLAERSDFASPSWREAKTSQLDSASTLKIHANASQVHLSNPEMASSGMKTLPVAQGSGKGQVRLGKPLSPRPVNTAIRSGKDHQGLMALSEQSGQDDNACANGHSGNTQVDAGNNHRRRRQQRRGDHTGGSSGHPRSFSYVEQKEHLGPVFREMFRRKSFQFPAVKIHSRTMSAPTQ